MKILYKTALLEICQDQYENARKLIRDHAAISRKALINLLNTWTFFSYDSFNLAFWIEILNLIDELLSQSFDDLFLVQHDISKHDSFSTVVSLLKWTAKFLNLSYNKQIFESLDVSFLRETHF